MNTEHNFNITFGDWIKDYQQRDIKNIYFENYIKELSNKEGYSFTIKLFKIDDKENISLCDDILEGCFEVFELKENRFCENIKLTIIYDYHLVRYKQTAFSFVEQLRPLIKYNDNIIFLSDDYDYIKNIKNRMYYRDYKQYNEYRFLCQQTDTFSIKSLDRFKDNVSCCCNIY